MSALEEFARTTSSSWPVIAKARTDALERLTAYEAAFVGTLPPDVSLVVFGSAARLERTSKSDVDWTLLIDGSVDPLHHRLVAEAANKFRELGDAPPGREATFGGISISHDLVHLIGGEEDSNANLTRRLLLLLESAVVGDPAAYQRVLRALLHRYISEDFGWQQGTTDNVPRFLLNDVVRYWRTVAVDFAYKRRERALEGWALRTVKLRMSRKLTFARGLLMCFNCADDPQLSAEISAHPKDGTFAITAAVGFLMDQIGITPLDALAAAVSRHTELHAAGVKLFHA